MYNVTFVVDFYAGRGDGIALSSGRIVFDWVVSSSVFGHGGVVAEAVPWLFGILLVCGRGG